MLLGAPPGKYWPYNIVKFDVEPPTFCYQLAENWKAVKYFGLAATRSLRRRFWTMPKPPCLGIPQPVRLPRL